jgi:hypothetical protein
VHSTYLNMMGIDVWRLRHQQHKAQIFPAGYALALLREGRRVGFMLAVSETDDPSITQLLDKMIAALKCQRQGQWSPALAPVDDWLVGSRVIIALGDGLPLSEFTLPVIHSHSPKQLIAAPPLKAETWQALQAVFPLIDE